jgi:CDP-glucose 4,6-dehydratase
MGEGDRQVEGVGGLLVFDGTYRGTRVLVTGHTGFKGSWLSSWLLELGANVAGYSIDLPSQPCHFDLLGMEQRITHCWGDVRDREHLTAVFREVQPEIVFHLAAQALVRRSYDDPTQTFETNAIGTMNVLECIRHMPSVRAAVLITSDKCYRNVEWTWGYRENDVLGGDDPYSASKACAELVAAAYMRSFFTDGPSIATTRAGNVIGGGDWATDRLIPDCVRSWSRGQPVIIRHPGATRPWQHVLEPLSGYLWLGAQLLRGATDVRSQAFNFGPLPTVNKSVGELLGVLSRYWADARWEVDSSSLGAAPESQLLKLTCDKALHLLSWRAILPFHETLRLTGEWYRAYYSNGTDGMADITRSQILGYEELATQEGLHWTE